MRSLMSGIRYALCILLLLPLLLIPGMLPGSGQLAAGDAPGLKAILGTDAAAWTLTGNGYSMVGSNTQQPTLMTAPTGSVTLTGKTRYEAPADYRFTLRLHPSKPYGASFNVAVGVAENQAFSAGVSSGPDGKNLNYSCSSKPETGKPIAGAFALQAVSERSLAWSEEMRKTIEAQMAAAPQMDKMLISLRLLMTRETFTVWAAGRFIGQFDVKPNMTPAGTVNITLYYGAELVSAKVLPYKGIDGRFFPLELGGFLNASALADGQPLTKKPVAAVDQDVMLDGAAFRFPASNAGNDHLDLTPSWTRFGALSGYIAANFGSFGGRWISANKMDPSRFCMYVPYGQYRALHLIAAFDGGKDKVPVITAQFYRPDAGHPMNFSGTVPAFSAKARGVKAFPVTLANGKAGNLYHVVIPIDPNKMTWFSDLQRVGLELTKAVQPYRAYPDPLEYSWHAAGLPSGVQVYAATLETAKVEVDPQPDAISHVWTAPLQPSYTIRLRNNTGTPVTAKLTITATGYNGAEKLTRQMTVSVPAGDAWTPVKVDLQPKLYGLHTLTVTCNAGGESTSYLRNFAYLHPDTRERGNWAEGKGSIFGCWNWGGGHDTPGPIDELTVMGQAGAETNLSSYTEKTDPKVLELARKYKLLSTEAFQGHCMYVNAFSFGEDAAAYQKFMGGAVKDPAGLQAYLIDKLRQIKVPKGEFTQPEYLPFFPEPQIGRITSGIWPTHYSEPDYQLPKEDEAYFQNRLELFLTGASAVKKEWPDVKILLPYGDPMYTALFMRKSPEARALIDGCALDLPNFERIPEQQINQVVLNRLYPIMQDIKQYKPDPYLVIVEGTCVSSKDYDTTPEDQSNVCTRNFLVLMGYGVNNHPSSNAPFDCANYWGENHYGGGYLTQKPWAMPKISYVSYATLTRQINRCNFVKYEPTGSTSVYCQQYKHYKDNHLVHVLWTIRGTRPVSVKVPDGATVEVYDVNDNPLKLTAKNGLVTFTIGQAPVYLQGVNTDAEITLGTPNHADAAPAKIAQKISNLGNGSWALAAKRDMDYENTNKLQIERFLGNMTAQPTAAPKAQGGKALAVHLGPQQIDRKVMPYYTTFEPAAPVIIPGKATHLGLWVKASSDWGRVVYSLKDAKGERWLSVGTKDDWNCDDMRAWSAFCFDGWRYVRFELPAHAPYDSYREIGTSNWGSYNGDGIVDLPISLEKVIVERRSSVIWGNSLVPAKSDDVLLGDLYAEYASATDKTDEAVRQNKLRMPLPAGAPSIENPIAEMEQNGAGASTQVLRVADPDHRYDGTRCHVFFNTVAGAKSYDIWVSPYADGRGAMKLGGSFTESGQLIEGLRPDTDFYVFVVYTDADGKLSKPSQPLKIRLKNKFLYQ